MRRSAHTSVRTQFRWSERYDHRGRSGWTKCTRHSNTTTSTNFIVETAMWPMQLPPEPVRAANPDSRWDPFRGVDDWWEEYCPPPRHQMHWNNYWKWYVFVPKVQTLLLQHFSTDRRVIPGRYAYAPNTAVRVVKLFASIGLCGARRVEWSSSASRASTWARNYLLFLERRCR